MVQASKSDAVGSQAYGTMKTAGADPNDPALHGLSEEDSGHTLSRGVSPPAPSFTRGVSFSSTHSSGPIGSPGRRDLEQGDSFTRPVTSAKERGHHEHEGVELGTMKGSSGNMGQELVAEQLYSLAPDSEQMHAGSSASRHAQPQSRHGSQAGADKDAGPQSQPKSAADSDSRTQPQLVSFQSLAALASLQANQAAQNSSVMPSASSSVAAGVESDGGTAGTTRHTQAQSPFKSAAEGESDSAAQHQGRLAAVSTGRPDAAGNSGTSSGRDGRTSDPPGVGSARPAALDRIPSEKKWAYPMPTGSPMFERVRSRNHDEESRPATPSQPEQSQPVAAPADAAAVQEPAHLPQAAVKDRSILCMRIDMSMELNLNQPSSHWVHHSLECGAGHDSSDIAT